MRVILSLFGRGMNLNSSRLKIEQYNYKEESYATKPIANDSAVIEGSFYMQKPITMRDMITRRINKTLGFFLGVAIVITFVSYYIAMNYEAKLNNLDNEIVRINAENQDLQSELDRYKSFNNVDNKIGEFNLLQKAQKVIEVTALTPQNKESNNVNKTATNDFSWAIGY